METATEGGAMAKAKGRPKNPRGEGTVVRIDSDLATKAKYLATRRDVPMSEFLSSLLRPAIEKEFRKAGRELLADGEGGQ
jgi:hypothetical protein